MEAPEAMKLQHHAQKYVTSNTIPRRGDETPGSFVGHLPGHHQGFTALPVYST
jgi:hypothetical protein